MIDFSTLEYLKQGNSQQRLAYSELQSMQLFERLECFTPLLAGTIPIAIDIEGSDLDVVCYVSDHNLFRQVVEREFGDAPHFVVEQVVSRGMECTVCRFRSPSFEIELFGQNIPSHNQNAYRHMLIEHQILVKEGEDFRAQVLKLKEEGLKTEPAFAKLLGLNGDPYDALLNLEQQ